MTHYWWMHWFWITFSFSQISVVFGQPLPTTFHSNIQTTPISTTTVPSPSKTTETLLNSTNTTTTTPEVLLRNLTQYARNTTETIIETSKLGILPLNIPPQNESDTGAPVINQNITEIVGRMKPMSENSSNCLDDLKLNRSFVQSERLDVVETDEQHTAGTNLSAAGITGITLACVVVVGIICGVSFFIYQNRGFNRPQVLNDRCSNPDSSGYIDDASVRDNSEEMYSLDNDSFLNSLEAMTIQNYWTDTVKHTKL